ncbi:trypsin-like serine protease [Thermoleophilia bacterium SCSIO 60948]|nr:trypsin-like serine protease [Thermoleophilia bacterium SCSIO 60948]
MRKVRGFLGSAIGGGLVGGLVVAVLGYGAIATGVIDAGDDGATTATLTPVDDAGSGANTRPVSNSNAPTRVGQIYENSSSGIAFIQAEGVSTQQPSPFGGPQRGTATGSGFLLDDSGNVLTNAHVVEGAREVEVRLGSAESDPVQAKVVGTDPSTDVAVLKIDALDGATPLSLGDSGAVAVGDEVIAIGSPFGLDQTVTAGIISALDRNITSPNGYQISDALQTDAPINPGNSGGPLLDANGAVIGINSQIESSGGAEGGNVGIGFAVPINTAKQIADELIATGEAEHAYLGLSGGDLTPELADALSLPSGTEGAIVGEVTPNGPADKAGLEGGSGRLSVDGQQVEAGGDLITAVNGKDISGFDDVIAAVDASNPGEEIELTVLRDGESQTVSVELGERPKGAAS